MTGFGCFTQTKQQRKQKKGPYLKTNAYTQKPALEQIATLTAFLLQLIGHSIFIVPALDDIQIQLLWVLLGFHYVLFLVIAYDYFYLTISDPVDKLLISQQLAAKYVPQDLHMCILCNAQVRNSSHHCMRCDRCTQQFDHHCKFLNNCIGSRNYQAFFRLLTIYTTYNINLVGQCIWVIIKNFEDTSIAFTGNQWGILSVIIITGLIQIMVGALLVFHAYISCVEETTTFGHMYPSQRDPKDPIQQININLWGAPASAERLGRQQGKILF